MKVIGILLIFFVLKANSARNRITDVFVKGSSEIDNSTNPSAQNVLCEVKTIIDSTADQIQTTCQDLAASNDRDVKAVKAKCNTANRFLNSFSKNLPKDCSDSSQTTNSPAPTTIKASTQFSDFTTPAANETATEDISPPAPEETATELSDFTSQMTTEETTTKFSDSPTSTTTTQYSTTPVTDESTTKDSLVSNSTITEDTTEYTETPEMVETTIQDSSTPITVDTTTHNATCHENGNKRCNDYCINHRRINLGGSCKINVGNSAKCSCIKINECQVYQNASCQSDCSKKSSNGYCKIPEKNIPCACRFQSETGNNIYYELP